MARSTYEEINVGPFTGGLNTLSDQTSINDLELHQMINFECDKDGSLVSRPPIFVRPSPGISGTFKLLGYYVTGGTGTYYLIGSVGTSTYYYANGVWTLLTDTFAATSCVQFQEKLWLVAPLTSANNGGTWNPGGIFTAVATMPKGAAIVANKNRLWVAQGKNAEVNGSRMYVSDLDPGTSAVVWDGDYIDISPGDGQNIVDLAVVYSDLVIFKERSTYRFAFEASVSTGSVSRLSENIGVTDVGCFAAYENQLFVLFEDNVYDFTNYIFNRLNYTLPLRADNPSEAIVWPRSISVWADRVFVCFYEKIYVYSLVTRTWSEWQTDYFDALGRILEVPSVGLISAAYVHGSSPNDENLPAIRTNIMPDPMAYDLTRWGVFANGGTFNETIVTDATDGPTLPDGTKLTRYVRYTCTVASTSTPVRAGYEYNAGAGFPIDNTKPFSASIYFRLSLSAGSNRVTVRERSATGVEILTSGTFTSDPANVWILKKIENVNLDPLSETITRLGIQISRLIEVDATLDVIAIIAEAEPTVEAFFAGSTVDTIRNNYAWLGADNASHSTNTTLPYMLGYIEDGYTSLIATGIEDSEQMVCIAETKNYDFQSPSKFKRLRLWGIDAFAKSTVNVLAKPVRFAAKITWGQMKTQPWSFYADKAWGRLSDTDYVVADTVSVSTTTGGRKWIKFLKSLRFRQIAFRIELSNDGTQQTAPSRIFKLTTYVKEKALVPARIN